MEFIDNFLFYQNIIIWGIILVLSHRKVQFLSKKMKISPKAERFSYLIAIIILSVSILYFVLENTIWADNG